MHAVSNNRAAPHRQHDGHRLARSDVNLADGPIASFPHSGHGADGHYDEWHGAAEDQIGNESAD